MSKAIVTNRQEWLKACVKAVSDSDVNKEASGKLIELLVTAFDTGIKVAIEGKCEVIL